jgi:hypothetical protein
MPKKKSKKNNTKGAEVTASVPTSPFLPSEKWRLPIREVMEEMNACKKVKDKLKAGQWILKPSCKGHAIYYRYVLKEGRIQKQIVTHSCTSGSKAEGDRARDLIRSEYTDVEFVISSVLVQEIPLVYGP